MVSSQLCLADRGYQGFAKRHAGACTPTKKPRNQPLAEDEKQHNRALARLRVRVEHVIRRFKTFASSQDATATEDGDLACA